MILFYSEYCPHCRMLKETIKNYDKNNTIIKLVCIDVLRKKGQQIPSQIKSVPALIKMPNKDIIFGKEVFDYLLLPGSGLLLKQKEITEKTQESNKINKVNKENTELFSFTFNNSSKYSTSFASIDDETTDVLQESVNSWSNIEEDENTEVIELTKSFNLNEKTRVNKEEFDFDKFKIQRDLDIRQKDLNNLELAPPINPRD